MQPTLSSVMQPRTQSCPSSPRCDSGQVISSYMALGIGSRCQDQWNIWPRATLLLKIEKSFDISRLTQSPDMCLEVSWIADKVFRLTNFCKRPIRTIYSVSAWSILAFSWLGAFSFFYCSMVFRDFWALNQIFIHSYAAQFILSYAAQFIHSYAAQAVCGSWERIGQGPLWKYDWLGNNQ